MRLAAEKKLPAPKTIEVHITNYISSTFYLFICLFILKVTEAIPNKAIIGKSFKSNAKAISELLSKLSLDDINTLNVDLETSG